MYHNGKTHIHPKFAGATMQQTKKVERKRLVHFYQEEKYRKRVDAFWSTFSENAAKVIPAFKGKNDFKVHDVLGKALKKVHPDLEYYLFPRGERHMELVISIRSRMDLYPVVDLMWEKCRTIGRAWCFSFRRQREYYDFVKFLVEIRTGGNLDEFQFSGNLDSLNRINLLFIHKDAVSVDNQFKLVDMLCEGLCFIIGEKNQRVWMGSFDLISQSPREEKIYPLRDLPKFFDEKIEEAKKRLPKEPYGTIEGTAQWVGIDFEPPEDCDYTGRSDMITLCTMVPEVIESAYNEIRFYSERFTNFEETFCYLKMERWKTNDEEENEEYKQKLIEELNLGLRKNEIGMVVGVGTGLKYAYIDFVISNISRGGRIIQSKLRKFKVTKNAWIMFFDSAMESKWIGVYDDTPPPLMPDFEYRAAKGISKRMSKILDKKLKTDK